MLALTLALALFAQGAEAAQPAPEAAAPAEENWPTGAPREDYPFVGWCYGVLRQYLEMHDEVMPEVTRIETAFRRPGAKLSDDLKVYADMQKDGREKLKLFQSALTAAEKASVRPINLAGAAAVRQGRAVWTSSPATTKAAKAQAWMSWVLPARCETTAANLEARSKLMGASLRVNEGAAPAETPVSPSN
jgi:hypothetical protein